MFLRSYGLLGEAGQTPTSPTYGVVHSFSTFAQIQGFPITPIFVRAIRKVSLDVECRTGVIPPLALRTEPALSCRSNSLLTLRIHFRGK